MSRRFSCLNWLLAAVALFLLAPVSAFSLEVVQNGSFSAGLSGWQTAVDVSPWPVLQAESGNTFISLHPGKAFRGPLVYQNLNVTGIAGATVTASVGLRALDSYISCGRSVGLHLEYVTSSGQHREALLLNPEDCDAGYASFQVFSASFTLPANAQKITRLSLVRLDHFGQVAADNVSLQVPASATIGPVPQITSLGASSGSYGQMLTVFGSGFGSNLSGNGRVTIGGVDAGPISSWANTQISVTLAAPVTSGVVRVIADGVESDGSLVFNVTSPNFSLNSTWEPVRVIRGQLAKIPIGVQFNNGYTTGSGITFTLSGSPAPPPHSFAPAQVAGEGGTLLTLQTSGMPQGDYYYTLTASDPASGSVSRTVRVQVVEVGQIIISGKGPGGTWGPVSSLTIARQGLFDLIAEARDLAGREIRGIDFTDIFSWSSSDSSKVLAVRRYDQLVQFIANGNGDAVLTVTTPDGFSADLPVTVNFPVTPSFTQLTLSPSAVSNVGPASVSIVAQATGFAFDFGLAFPGSVTGSYSDGGLQYNGTGSVQSWRPLGNHLVSVGNLYEGAGRAAVLAVQNDPATGIIRGTVAGLQPPGQSNSDGILALVELYDATTGNLVSSTYAFKFYSYAALPEFSFPAVAPGAYKIRLQPSGTPLPPRYNQAQWYPNATSIAGAGVINVSAGASIDNINLFYTLDPKPLPQVVATTPQNGATGVPLNQPVVVQFDQEMEDLSIISSQRSFVVRDGMGNQVFGQYQLQDSGRRAVFIPNEPFAPNSAYNAAVTTFAYSRQGLHLQQDYLWTFTTGDSLLTPPQVVSVYPGEGSTNVSPNTFIYARFNREMDPASFIWDSIVVEDEFQNVYYGDIELDGDIAIFRPWSSLDSNRQYTARISAGVADLFGLPIGNEYTWSFTTGEIGPPKVVFTVPSPGQTGVAANTSVIAYFDQWMATWSINSSSFILQDDSSAPVSGTITVGQFRAELTPDSPLEEDRIYTATLTTDVQSNYGYPLEQNYSWSFSTGMVSPDAPRILAVYPQPDSTDASSNTVIQVLFDREIDPESLTLGSFTLDDSSSSAVGGSIELDGQVVRFIPWSWLGTDTYTATVGATIRSREGFPLGIPYSWSFTPQDTVAPPRVTFTLPEDNEANVEPSSRIRAYFDQDVQWETVNTNSFLLADSSLNLVNGNAYSSTPYSAVFQPWSPLAANSSYTATLTTDVTSNQSMSLASDYNWTFTTGEPGLILYYTSPGDGITDVGVNENVLGYFDQEIDPDTVTASTFFVKDPDGNLVAGTRQAVGSEVLFYPSAPLRPMTRYTAVLTTGIRSLGGFSLRRNYAWSFTTGSDAGLQVTTTSPYNGYQAWWRNKAISAEFNQDLDGSTVNASTFQLRDAQNNLVPGSVTHQYRMAWFTPSVLLQPSATYTATLTTGIRSVDNSPLTENYQWSFTTAANTDNRLGAIKALPDGTRVAFSNKGLHFGTSNRGYIQEFDRSSGIRLDGFLQGYEGRAMDVSGILQTDGNGERYITPLWMWIDQFQNVLPVRATNRTVGERMMDGLNVQVWGRVLAAPSANTIVISDGSSPAGLRVNNPTQPITATIGSTVLVTGAAGWDGNRIIFMRQISQLDP